MGLFGSFGKKKQTSKIRVSFEQLEDTEYLVSDDDLPWGWLTANKAFIEKVESEYRFFFDAWYSSRTKGILEEYAAVKSLVLYMEDVKQLCASKGKCFSVWASDLVANQELLEQRKARQKYIEENIDKLLDEEKRKRHIETDILPTLREDLIATIKAEPGLIQSELFKRFDADLKQYIQQELYCMDKDGTITREKNGRSYALFLNS